MRGLGLLLPALTAVLLPWSQALADAPVEMVRARVAPGLTALARYHAGPMRQPAVLLVHGFLDSGEAHPAATLGRGLSRDGIAVLAPTLTLGIERRRQRLACEALQLHDLPQAAAEIAVWIDWLLARGYQRIVPVTFGTGLLPVVEYLERHPSGRVGGVLALVPPDPDQPWGAPEMRRLREQARQALAAGDRKIGEFRLEACREYRAPPAAFLSYARWDREALLRRLRTLRLPLRVVAGESVDPTWEAALRAAGIDVQNLPETRVLRDPDRFDSLVQLVGGMLRSIQ